MAIVHGYCTLAQLRAQISDKASAADTTTLEACIQAASRAVDDWCGRRFWADATPTSRQYEPDDCGTLRVDDVASGAGLTVETDTSGSGSWSALAAGAFRLRPANALADGRPITSLRALSTRWPTGGLVRVTALHGWPSVPDAVGQSTVLKSAALYDRRNSPHGVAGVGDFGVVRITRGEDPDVVRLLEPYQLVMVA